MNSFGTLNTLQIGEEKFQFHSLAALEKNTGKNVSALPYCIKILLENLLRNEDGEAVTKHDIEAILNFDFSNPTLYEIQFTPARVLLQDFTGVPVVADLAAMRDGMAERGGQVQRVNPLRPVDLVIDHSVQMDSYGEPSSLSQNNRLEFQRNAERYEFLKWGQRAFTNFRVVPPSTGICHQVNLEYLAHVAMTSELNGEREIFPDTLVGTDSHTTMINGLGVLGWGVGGIEAEAAMLGQPCTMLIPEVIGVELTGKLKPGVTATDLVLTVTQLLRKTGVVAKFVEYFGDGVRELSVADRATIGNMSPEYGATVGLFPVDEKVVQYLQSTGREERAKRTEAYFKAQGMWGSSSIGNVVYTRVVTLNLETVEPSMSGPSRPHDRVSLGDVRKSFRTFLINRYKETYKDYSQKILEDWANMSESMKSISYERNAFVPEKDLGHLTAKFEVRLESGDVVELRHGSIVIAAITSCTNTSNPALMLGAALLARNARKLGLKSKPWVKTTFAPGSLVVRDYLTESGLLPYLEELGFFIAGFGCATCIGNSGPLPQSIQNAIEKSGIATASVLSGNRNFEARIHPTVMANYLASPPLVVAAAIAGDIAVDLSRDAIGFNSEGKAVYLKDVWPEPQEVEHLIQRYVAREKFSNAYSSVFDGNEHWRSILVPKGERFDWSETSTYIKRPPFLDAELEKVGGKITGARILAVFGDFITTDHISPAGSIKKSGPAGQYLTDNGVSHSDFNSFGSRRGNHEVMIRGTFANVRIRNLMAKEEGGVTVVFPENKEMSIYEAAKHYAAQGTSLVVFAGKEYGSGSSRDWAAKGTRLLGVRAVVAESFERIHRSNLVGMGVLPLELLDGQTTFSLKLNGDEEVDLPALDKLKAGEVISLQIRRGNESRHITVKVRIDTPNELKYYRSGGILPFVLNKLNS